MTQDPHRCALPRAEAAGDHFTCVCRSRWVAVRRRWWSRRLRWEPVLFAVPPDLGGERHERELG
ncbi:hypothetical protein [Pseudonocardia xishanensis]|uniref:Uncharacterized protein n=1 Tax=Pseudonocardia xishanensis TaxID=630995 RepID=A0ABP8RW44_9PSEU